ncbi:MAG TPA: ABC transporter permease [Chitinophagaceae bacterium]|nr:ABC transporter permease [Chitinophagaceae bacterium]
MNKIIKYVILDILKNRIIIGYAFLLLVMSLSVFNLETDTSKGILSLLNVILIIVPLVSIIFSTIYIYNASEFIELLVSQPLQRKNIWLSIVAGLGLSLSVAFLAGCALPILLYEGSGAGLMISAMGLLLTIIFVAIAALAAVYTRDKAKGIGLSILIWLFFTLLYDGLVMFLLFQFMDYPVEKGLVAVSMLNPVDLSRIMILLKLDISALMGVTSAVFKSFFGQSWGMILSISVMLLWVILPLFLSVKKFKTKNL